MTNLKIKNASNSTRAQDLKKILANDKTIVSLNILIDEDLRHQFKIKTLSNKETMTDAVLRMIKDYLR